MNQTSQIINYVHKYISQVSKFSSFRFLNNDKQQKNQIIKQDSVQDKTSLEENLDLANSISQIFFYVMAGISSFILLCLIVYLIKLCCIYCKKSKSKYLKKQLDCQSAISQGDNNSNNLIIKQSNDVDSINQENQKFEQSQKVILVQHELEKELSTIDVQNNVQFSLNNNVEQFQQVIENLDLYKQYHQDQKRDSVSNQQEQIEAERIDQYNNIGQEEKAQETYNSQVFHLEHNSYTPPQMTPSFNNNQFNFYQFGGSEKNFFTQTNESIKTQESFQFLNRENKQSIKKKTLFEYNNQILKPMHINNTQINNNFQNGYFNTLSERYNYQLMDYNKYQALSDEQKYLQQLQIKYQLDNQQDLYHNNQNNRQYIQNNNQQDIYNPKQYFNHQKEEQCKEDQQNTEQNKNEYHKQQQKEDKENQYPINYYNA